MNDPYLPARLQMVEEQIVSRGITDSGVIGAMQTVPRHLFVGASMRNRAYNDSALPLEANQTISQPYIVALMTQSLRLTGTEKVLEIGTGSGYQAAILSTLARKVFTIERLPELARKARATLEKHGYGNVVVTSGDGTLGWAKFAPYDGIMITAAAPRLPVNLLNQLADGGRMVVPVGDKNTQTLKIIRKDGDEYSQTDSIDCIFVPLLGFNGWEK